MPCEPSREPLPTTRLLDKSPSCLSRSSQQRSAGLTDREKGLVATVGVQPDCTTCLHSSGAFGLLLIEVHGGAKRASYKTKYCQRVHASSSAVSQERHPKEWRNGHVVSKTQNHVHEAKPPGNRRDIGLKQVNLTTKTSESYTTQANE